MNPASSLLCRGLSAGFLTGWLAAVGATVIEEDLRLCWTDGDEPNAVFTHQRGVDPVEALIVAWPSLRDRLAGMPAAMRNKRYMSVMRFADLLEKYRGHPDSFSLTSAMTDLLLDPSPRSPSQSAALGRFETPAQGKLARGLHYRCREIYEKVPDFARGIEQMFGGTPERLQSAGLALDAERIGSVRDDAEKPMVDPVVETLAYFALVMFPVRSDGIQRRGARAKQRGWQVGPYGREFIWPAWRQPLDRWGIDALLTAWHNTWRRRGKDDWRTSQAEWGRLGVHAAWKTTRYRPKGSSDTTRGYGSQPLLPNEHRTRSSNRSH